MEASEADFFTTRPAAERTGGQLRRLGNMVASYRKLGGGSGRGRHSHGQEYRLTSHTECSQAGPIRLSKVSLWGCGCGLAECSHSIDEALGSTTRNKAGFLSVIAWPIDTDCPEKQI